MRLNVAVPEARVTKPVLDAALESVTRLNESLLKDGSVPTAERAIKNGAIWKPEPYEDEHFDHAGIVVKRGWGDCDDWAPYHAASLRHTGKDPGAVAVVRRSGPRRWHAIVNRSNGTVDDPSIWAGMGQEHSVHGASLPLMWDRPSGVDGIYTLQPGIAMRPLQGKWQARVDIPWHTHEGPGGGPIVPTDYAMASLANHVHANQALIRAIEGACRVGIAAGIAHPDHIQRLNAIADYCDGADHSWVSACYGPEHADAAREVCGSIFTKVYKVAKKVAKTAAPIAMRALRFVPGASQALSAYDLAKEARGVITAVHRTLQLHGVPPGDVARLVRAGFPVI
jgi:hypothetical protein